MDESFFTSSIVCFKTLSIHALLASAPPWLTARLCKLDWKSHVSWASLHKEVATCHYCINPSRPGLIKSRSPVTWQQILYCKQLFPLFLEAQDQRYSRHKIDVDVLCSWLHFGRLRSKVGLEVQYYQKFPPIPSTMKQLNACLKWLPRRRDRWCVDLFQTKNLLLLWTRLWPKDRPIRFEGIQFSQLSYRLWAQNQETCYKKKYYLFLPGHQL